MQEERPMKPYHFGKRLLRPALLGCLILTAGCGDDNDEKDDVATRQAVCGEESAPKEPGLVTVTEPAEQAYTLKMPEGWKNQAALVQVYDQKRALITAVAPGGDTFLFLGDPQMPAFSVPTPGFDSDNPVAKSFPLLKTASYTPAKEFFTDYLQKKFGKLPEFRIVGTAPNPRLEKLTRAAAERQGVNNADISTVLIAFDYRDNGKLIRSMVNGLTLRMGTVWIADVNGVSTTDDPAKYNDLLLQMAESLKSNPEWQARQRALSQQRHEATMAMIQSNTEAMTRRHQANMAAIQASAARHQQRMASLQAAGDARLNAWKEQQAQNDASHQGFLNYIKGENTVANSSGATFQVEAGQDRYFRNKSTNAFVGTDSTKELEDLRKIWGLNPDDYEDVKVRR
jgi:hypothetical protein